MKSKFQLVKGVEIKDISLVQEGYESKKQKDYYVLTTSVSAEKIEPLFVSLCNRVNQPAFFVLECSSNYNDEKELRKTPEDDFHKDVFFLDAIDYERLLELFSQYKDALINSGGLCFGYSAYSQNNTKVDEVYVGPYKVFYIYTTEPKKYEAVLRQFDLTKRKQLVTLPNVINRENPGSRISRLPDSLYAEDLVEELKRKGLKFIERRPDQL